MTSPATTPAVGDRLTAAQGGIIAAAVDDYEAAWTAYTPVLTSTGTAPSLGTGGTAVGIYKLLGGPITPRMCEFHILLTWGTAPAAGTLTYEVSLPVAWISDGIGPLFTALYATSTAFYSFTGGMGTTASKMHFLKGDATANLLGAAYPAAPAINNTLQVSGVYRIG